MIFANLLENSLSKHGRSYTYQSYTYRLYSGNSEADLRRKIVENLKDSLGDYTSQIVKLDPIFSLKNIVLQANDIIHGHMDNNNYEDPREYDLSVEGPYTDMGKALDFYDGYLEMMETVDFEDHEDIEFYFYGDYAISIQEVFPYLSDLRREFGVSISHEYIQRLSSLLLE